MCPPQKELFWTAKRRKNNNNNNNFIPPHKKCFGSPKTKEKKRKKGPSKIVLYPFKPKKMFRTAEKKKKKI